MVGEVYNWSGCPSVSLNAYKCFFMVGTREGNKPRGKPRHSWEDNVNTNRKRITFVVVVVVVVDIVISPLYCSTAG